MQLTSVEYNFAKNGIIFSFLGGLKNNSRERLETHFPLSLTLLDPVLDLQNWRFVKLIIGIKMKNRKLPEASNNGETCFLRWFMFVCV